MNFIPLFNEKINISEEVYINHPSFHFGRIINCFNDIFEIEFLGIGIKKISRQFSSKMLSREVIVRMLSDFLFAERFVKCNGRYGKIVETFSNRVVVKYGTIEEINNIYYDKNLNKVEFDFAIINEAEYFKHENEAQTEMNKENQKYIGMKVIHNKYGNGTIVGCTADKVSIEFSEKTAVFTLDFMKEKMKLLDSTQDKFIQDTETSVKKHIPEVSEGDILKIPYLGRVLVNDVSNDYLILENIEHESFKYRTDSFKENYKLAENDIFEYKTYDFVFHDRLGYCRVLGISNHSFDLIKIYDYEIVSLPIRYINLFEKVKDSLINDLLSCKKEIVEVNGILGVITRFEKTQFEMYSFIDEQYIKVKYEDLRSFSKNIQNEEHYSFKSAVFTYAKRDYYLENELRPILLDCAQYLPLDSNTKFIKNNINALLRRSGFKAIDKVDSIYLDIRYNDLEEYLISLAIREDFIFYDNELSSQYYDYLLGKMCRQHLCIKLYDEKYLTIKKMAEFGITINSFEELKEEIDKVISSSAFVTLEQLLNTIDNDICRLLPDENVFMDLIKTYDVFKTYKLGNRIIFSRKSDFARNEAIEQMFISLFYINNKTSMDIFDLVDVINEKYGFGFTKDSFMMEIRRFTKLYYSKDTERVYLSKEQYYKEIFE